MKDVLGVLQHLGYGEIRPKDTGQWAPLSEVNGRYGTTEETHIISRKRLATCRLVDVQTDELVATARKSCPLNTTE